ncbi:unnamed protein product [Spodoptera exigua]|nr:unnamed protein product [Spodoptera exigua]
MLSSVSRKITTADNRELDCRVGAVAGQLAAVQRVAGGNAPLCPSTTSYQMMLQGSDRHHSLRAGFRGTSDQTDALDLSSRFSGASQGSAQNTHSAGIPPFLTSSHLSRSSVLEQQQLLRTLITGIRHVSELANLLAKINETFEGVYTPPPNPTSASFSYPTGQRAAGMGFPLTANPASNIDLATLMSRLDETNRGGVVAPPPTIPAAPPPPLPYATSYGNLDFRDSPYFRSIYEYYLRQNLPGYLQSLANSTPLQPTHVQHKKSKILEKETVAALPMGDLTKLNHRVTTMPKIVKIERRSPATVSADLRTASKGDSPPDQNQTRVYGA